MESILLNYLEKIDKYLKPLAAAERADIINEIKSEMLELEAKDKLTSAQIVERLGNPKELAKAWMRALAARVSVSICSARPLSCSSSSRWPSRWRSSSAVTVRRWDSSPSALRMVSSHWRSWAWAVSSS